MSFALRLQRPRWTCFTCRQTTLPKRLHPIASSLRTFKSAIPPTEPPPPTAPKPQINIKSITQNVDLHTNNCLSRNYKSLASHPPTIANLYSEWITLQLSLRTSRERHNLLSGRLRSASPLLDTDTPAADPAESRAAIIAEARALKDQIAEVEVKEKQLQDEMKQLALALPNTTHPSTPSKEPRLLHYINPHLSPAHLGNDPADAKTHTQIGQELELLDFSSASTVSGWGWYYLLNDAVLLEQALIQYALQEARKAGFTLVAPPSMVYSHMASACGFRPRDQNDEQQIYAIEKKEGKAGHVLAGTAEIPLAGMLADTTVLEEQLPRKVVGVSRCYRAEAGARGVESKGLYRVHEFTKVELFAWAPPPAEGETSNPVAEKIFDDILSLQERILSGLGLHCRVLEMPATDLGASAHRKIDIEAYIPSRHSTSDGPWGEVSSLSNCTDYQARRLATKVKRTKGVEKGSATGFAWTLNGTALAVPRVLVALLENGYSKGRDGVGRVRVPEVLQKWVGREWIEGAQRK
ncbi:seryl-tRNA synthetase [Ascobolus immersus RN42]|uniref:serine--tRNA ligase n=1 Tax=Ascobolus immersus RN42 TaxID=1160509 RepID=A0A3N4ICR8_ASCIM|nr:seryl-tRNA synthetase [Ascobolus immersus RN42]